MSEGFSPELRRELLDDFYAECDELLTAVREGLTQLEAGKGNSAGDPRVIEALFRSTHSLKGISAIVGLTTAEELAHGMEEVLRALSKGQTRVTDELVDALLASAQRLEKIVSAHRQEKPMPATEDLLRLLRPWISSVKTESPVSASAEPTPVNEEQQADPVEAAKAKGLILYRVTFAPSAQRDRQGLNVNSVRQRLGQLGEIIRATPIVRGKGVMVFEFMVGVREVPPDFSSWTADGIEFAPIAPEPVAPVPAALADEVSETLSLTPSHMVRVDLARLDDLMRIAGEMVIQRSRLEDRLQQMPEAQGGGLVEINRALGRSLREMREGIARVRMVPIAEIFARMPFVVRDLVRGTDKKVRVALEGNQTEVDKYLVERLKEPLLHLVRNAIAHGIENAAERTAAGKPAEATVTLRARSAGESVLIQVRDDGRGVDAKTVVARAKTLGVAVPERLDAAAVLAILCAPGFSTRDQADRAAGRGVGMDVVANTVRELGGTLLLDTQLGAGTEFTLKLPLTLSIANAIIVTVGDELCAVPTSAVEEIIQVGVTDVRTIKKTEVIPYRGGLLPFVRLRKMFGAPPAEATLLTLLVVSGERGATGLLVDRVRSQREIVIRPLSDPLLRVPGISGATELGDGRPILILDPNAITRGVVRPPNSTDAAPVPLTEATTS